MILPDPLSGDFKSIFTAAATRVAVPQVKRRTARPRERRCRCRPRNCRGPLAIPRSRQHHLRNAPALRRNPLQNLLMKGPVEESPKEACQLPNFPFSGEYCVVLFRCERCSFGPNSGFEIFVPGRLDGLGHNPGFRSAHLLKRTVSHCFQCLRSRISRCKNIRGNRIQR
jgi:hypothetical protein